MLIGAIFHLFVCLLFYVNISLILWAACVCTRVWFIYFYCDVVILFIVCLLNIYRVMLTFLTLLTSRYYGWSACRVLIDDGYDNKMNSTSFFGKVFFFIFQTNEWNKNQKWGLNRSPPPSLHQREQVCWWVFAFGLWACVCTIFMPHLRHWNGNCSMRASKELTSETWRREEKNQYYCEICISLVCGSGASSWLNPKKKQNWSLFACRPKTL